ncbi:scavenger receptor cysteine-rich type 1 protein M160-like [Ylistrum balloti]|uniref:scavenger receptor cysteine-rich type 1 protein M160-like n=1 Tax=Ylistrum balloti TaxID=509963 RepID=UPI0029059F00|nr:scavenger receptor cysteine-rich type 1 protein M160-like [Ylistrum balloti]
MESSFHIRLFLLGVLFHDVSIADGQTVQLLGGFSESSGRVQVLYSGQWGTVCDDYWDNKDAKVVCRMLGYSHGSAYKYSVFGEGSGLIWMSDVGCTGSESSIFDCPFPGWGKSTCTHKDDAGVVCFNDTDHTEVAVRLVEREGYYNSSGRVEVYYDGHWGYIGPRNWDNKDAQVVCRTLGYSFGHSASTFTLYHETNNRKQPTWMDYVQCNGSESSIADCPFGGWGEFSSYYSSNYQSTVFVACTTQKDVAEFDLRLMEGFSNTSGRVEVFYDGQWGTVCSSGWGYGDAQVACRMLGYSNTVNYGTAGFPRGTGVVWMKSLGCSGSESTLYDCDFDGWGSTCSHSSDVGVFCFNDTDNSEVAVRLVEVEGYHNRSGRVEVYHAGLWGYIGYYNWNDKDADVVCRMLGYKTGKGDGIYNYLDRNNVQHPTWMNNVRCNGNETTIADCLFEGWGSSYVSSSFRSAFVSCLSDSDVAEFDLRLMEGFSNTSGRVEVFYDGQWGTVCSSGWGYGDAQVACRMLGYSNTVNYGTAGFPRGTGVVWMKSLGCSGSESTLYDCDFDGWGSTCSHSSDVGVFCFNDTDNSEVAVRLVEVEGYHNRSGRVEVYHAGLWGYIGYYNWNDKDADVVCRMLGYKTGKGDWIYNYLDRNNVQHPTWMNNVRCNGNETTIADCLFEGWGPSYVSSSFRSAFVSCLSDSDVAEFDLRLMEGFSNTSGRVEVFYDGQWGTVCSSGWGYGDAQVACRMLGYSNTVNYGTAGFPRGTGVVWMKSLGCSGSESTLYDCDFDGWGSTCSHSSDVGVFCFNDTDNSEVAVRLVEVEGYHNRSGRVEVYHAGLWGYIGYYNWNDKDADVVCRMLGYKTGKGDWIYNYLDRNNVQHPTWMNNVRCNGNETTIADCLFEGWGSSYVSSSFGSAFVSCLSDSDVAEFDLRLMEGFSNTSGRVEVFYDGQWGTVCSSGWGYGDAQVACRMLGYSNTVNYGTAGFPRGTGVVWMKSLGCSGSESTLYDCDFDGWGSTCSHSSDVGVFCFNDTDNSEVAVRLVEVEGYHNRSGRVEVYHAGLWGYIGYYNWNDKDADVVCRMLGYKTGKGDWIYNYLDRNNVQHPTWMNNVRCNGNETTIADCLFEGWGSSYVSSSFRSAFVSCLSDSDVAEFDLRLMEGFSNTSGRVEVFYDGQWGTVCSSGWGYGDAQVACRMLGYSNTVNYGTAGFPRGTGVVWMKSLGCSGSESTLYDCDFDGWGSTCSHSSDVGVFCFNDTDNSEVAVRLVEVEGYHNRSGRVEVYHAGLWGYIGYQNWNDKDADVACRMLGYRTGKGDWIYYDIDYNNVQHPTWMQNVRCNGNETTIADCLFEGWGSSYISSAFRSAFVSCLSDSDIEEHAVRLVGGFSNSSGRVEVFFAGEWGAVCDRSWDNNDAQVVCRMLGFRYGSGYRYAVFGKGSGITWMSDVGCSGSETQLLQCPYDGFGSTCSHSYDVGVVCFNDSDISDIKFRLVEVEGYNKSSGRIEVFYGGYWGFVGSYQWQVNDAHVACRMFGYSTGSAHNYLYRFEGTERPKPTWMDSVECVGVETSLAQCVFAGWGVYSGAASSYQNSAFVKCTGLLETTTIPITTTAPVTTTTLGPSSTTYNTQSEIRLVNGFSITSGRVEVFHGDQWGTVCDDVWDSDDAKVVCRMLGYSHGSPYTHAAFGQGTDPVLIQNVECSGTESKLDECRLNTTGSSCDHTEDVGVVCFDSTGCLERENFGVLFVLREQNLGTGASLKKLVVISRDAKYDLFLRKGVLVPFGARCCSHHIEDGLLQNDACENIAIKSDLSSLNRTEIVALISKIRDVANTQQSKRIDFDSPHALSNEDFITLTGLCTQHFNDLCTHCAGSVRSSKNRSIKSCVGIFLTKLKSGMSNKVLSTVFNIGKDSIRRAVTSARVALAKDFVPSNLGFQHVSRQDIILKHTRPLAQTLFGGLMEPAILVIDGTYIYIQKSGQFMFQRRSYSMHKHRPLVKPMIFVTTTGYIVSVLGPYFADSKNNDASILNQILNSNIQEIKEWIQENDVFVFDRGFRDSMDLLQQLGIQTEMPSFSKQRKQHTTGESNASRLVTKIRWVVEAVNGRLKTWKYLDRVLPNSQIPYIGDIVRIVCAIFNKFEEDLRNLTLGVYQLKLARSYTQEHMSETGGYEVSICKVDANLINAKIQSRHFSSKLYQLWVSFDDCNVQGWYCTCRAGARVVGTCSHVASILWYMGFARHLDKSFDFSKDWTQYLQDASYTPDPISIDESDDEDTTSVEVRLVDMSADGQGRVEVYFSGYWGYVGGWYWDDKDARVACRMLGYKAGIANTVSHEFGLYNRQQPTWMDLCQCTGTELTIVDCPFGGFGVFRGSSSRDQYTAAVTCVNSK